MEEHEKRCRPKNKFGPDEDALLANLVHVYGESDWPQIASKMEHRNARQCHDRWVNYLSPRVEHGRWSEEEDNHLIRLYEEFGPKWVKIASCLPGRTDTHVKNHFLVLFRHYKKSQILAAGSKPKKDYVIPIQNIAIPPAAPKPDQTDKASYLDSIDMYSSEFSDDLTISKIFENKEQFPMYSFDLDSFE